MRQSNLPAFLPTSFAFSEIRDYAERHWFRLLLIGFGLYLMMVKDVNFQLSLNSADGVPESSLPADLWEKKNPSETDSKSTNFSMLSPVLTGEEGASKSDKAQQANLANTFSNLTFVLSPTYAQRKNIPAAIVAEKKAKCQAYIERFAPVAVAEMKQYGIPASITLAQGLLESNVGESRLTKANKNHFGVKCFSSKCQKGHCSNFTDDTHKDFFRIYQSAWESYRAHSQFLQGKRYAHLKKLGTQNYKAWAEGLYTAGYATDKGYAAKLIQIIEFLNLQQYDKG